MIHLTSIRKQHGNRLLLDNASLQILANSRIGLVGPNGAGKTTVFRLIVGEEIPDKGEISCGKRTVIGYFSQDVGEMSGRTVIAETMSAAGDILELGKSIGDMEAAMATPMDDAEMASLLER
jgi:ATP-binding cassette, subfamily F, member 3